MSKIAILIIEDHPVYRDALCEKLSNDFLSQKIPVQSTSSINEALSVLTKSIKNWVVLLDLKIPDTNPIDNIKAIKDLRQTSSLIVISGLEEDSWKIDCINAGADAFISKNNTSNFIYKKICELLDITDNNKNSEKPPLTARQLEILKLIVTGTQNKVIADQLKITEQTVKIHLNVIFKILNVSNRTQAVYKANQLKLL